MMVVAVVMVGKVVGGGQWVVGGAARTPLRPHRGGCVCAWSSLGSELETHHYGVIDKRGFKRMGHCVGRTNIFFQLTFTVQFLQSVYIYSMKSVFVSH